MASKYVALISGKLKEIEALVTSAGAGDAGKLIALDSAGRLDTTVMPVGIGANVVVATATEALTAGNFVNLYNSSGLKVRKADATNNTKPAQGFVLANVDQDAEATIYMLGETNTQLTSLTVGADYFLATTPGGVTATAPSAAGNIVQQLGRAHSATAIQFANVLTVEVG